MLFVDDDKVDLILAIFSMKKEKNLFANVTPTYVDGSTETGLRSKTLFNFFHRFFGSDWFSSIKQE